MSPFCGDRNVCLRATGSNCEFGCTAVFFVFSLPFKKANAICEGAVSFYTSFSNCVIVGSSGPRNYKTYNRCTNDELV